MCMIYESYEIGCVGYCVVIYVHIVLRRKGPVWHGRSAKTVLCIYHIGRKGPVWHGRSAKTVLYIILGGRDPYGTGGVRRRCYDIHIIASLQMIENEWLLGYKCVCVCVCDTRSMLDVLSYMTMKPSEYKFS